MTVRCSGQVLYFSAWLSRQSERGYGGALGSPGYYADREEAIYGKVKLWYYIYPNKQQLSLSYLRDLAELSPRGKKTVNISSRR
jgi:hypothetical protein